MRTYRVADEGSADTSEDTTESFALDDAAPGLEVTLVKGRVHLSSALDEGNNNVSTRNLCEWCSEIRKPTLTKSRGVTAVWVGPQAVRVIRKNSTRKKK